MSLDSAEAINRQELANLEKRIDAQAASTNEARAKYAYFLLAAAGACLAYGLEKLDGQPRSLLVLWAIGAYLAWLLSILSGCLSLENAHQMHSIRLEQLYLILGSTINSHERDTNQQSLAKLDGKLKKVQKPHLSQRRWQFYLLVAGVVAFAVWRLLAWWFSNTPAR